MRRSIPLSVAALFLCIACSSPQSESSDSEPAPQLVSAQKDSPHPFDTNEWDQEFSAWKSLAIAKYTFKLRASGFSNFPKSVAVCVSGDSVNVVSDNPKEKYVEAYKSLNTVDKLFALLEKEHNRNAEVLNVRYDKQYHYPAEIALDEAVSISDDELTVSAADLTPLSPVSEERAAIDIALKTWVPIYGKETIDKEQPYVAELSRGVWHVHGSLPEKWVGGVAEAWISQKDGKVIRYIHGE